MTYLKREVPHPGNTELARADGLHVPGDNTVKYRIDQQHDEDVDESKVIVNGEVKEDVTPGYFRHYNDDSLAIMQTKQHRASERSLFYCTRLVVQSTLT